MTLDLRIVGRLLLLDGLSLVQNFFVLLKWLFGGFVQVKADFFVGVGIFVGLGLNAPVSGLFFLLTSPQFVIDVHHG